MTNNQTLKAWLETTVATACVVSATTGSASVAMLTPGTTFSTFLECANDGISLVVGQNPTDGVFGGSVGPTAAVVFTITGLTQIADLNTTAGSKVGSAHPTCRGYA